MSTVQVTEDQTYVFKASDFTSGTLSSVTVTSLPTTGTLYLGGVPVTLNQIISATDISAGKFTFVPDTDVTTAGSFTDVVTTTLLWYTTSTSSSVTLNVTPDAGPSALVSSITAAENQTYTFQLLDFKYSDSADKTTDPIGSVTITSLPTDGTLLLSSTAVALRAMTARRRTV